MKIKPSFSEFKAMSRQGNLIPVYQEFLADTETPVSAYLKLRNGSNSYLLESADGGKRWGRYSFIGYNPFIRVISRDGRMEICIGSERRVLEKVRNPMQALKELNAIIKPVTTEDLPPFQGGLVGFVNYDLVRTWERLPGMSPINPSLPEAIFAACRNLVIFDHFTHMIKVVAFADLAFTDLTKKTDLEQTYERTCSLVAETVDKLQQPLPSPSNNGQMLITDLKPNFQKEDFEEAVRKAKEHIVAGDVIQVVLSQRFTGEIAGEDFALYRNLRAGAMFKAIERIKANDTAYR